MLMELSVMEQRYQAVLEVLVAGLSVTEVAGLHGVSRNAVHEWIGRYRAGGIAALADRSHRPKHHPAQITPEVEALICELRRAHPRWGPRRLVHEIAKGAEQVPSRSSIYRALVRNNLVVPRPRRKSAKDYLRWEREVPMQLWQHDFMEGVLLVDGTEGLIVTGVDDHSRFCIEAKVVARATGRAVCAGFVGALREYGCPDEVLTDNGKQFTGRLQHPRPVEVLFERICRENGIVTRHGAIHKPTTQGKVERLHQTIREELLDVHNPFRDLAAAQVATNAWRHDYNYHRPHQSLDMATPASRFRRVPKAEREALPLRVPPVLAAAPTPPASAPPAQAPVVTEEFPDLPIVTVAVEIDRVVPASGNLKVLPQQFWLGPALAGSVLTLWIDTQTVHLSIGQRRRKTLPSRFTTTDLAKLRADGARPAGPAPAAVSAAHFLAGGAVELERTVNGVGLVGLGRAQVQAGFPLAGQRVTLRLQGEVMQVISDGILVRTLPSPVPLGALARLRGARVAGPPPQVVIGPIEVQRRVSKRGGMMVAGQRVQVGLVHARAIVTVLVDDTTLTVLNEDGEVLKVVARTTSEEVIRFKAYGYKAQG